MFSSISVLLKRSGEQNERPNVAAGNKRKGDKPGMKVFRMWTKSLYYKYVYFHPIHHKGLFFEAILRHIVLAYTYARLCRLHVFFPCRPYRRSSVSGSHHVDVDIHVGQIT